MAFCHAAERLGDEFPILAKPYQITDLNRALTSLLGSPSEAPIDLGAARNARASKAGA